MFKNLFQHEVLCYTITMSPLEKTYVYSMLVYWFIFLSFWIATAANTKRTIWQQNKTQRFVLTSIMLIIYFLIIRSNAFNQVINTPLWNFSPVVGGIASSIGCIAVVILLWARIVLGRNWSGKVALKENHELITTGPYATIRHPIYTGMIFLLIANLFTFRTIMSIAMVVLISGLFLWRVFREEKLMAQTFPEQYAAYKARTKRLIPFVW